MAAAGLSQRDGHDVRAMGGVAFQTLMLRGTEWAATGRVTVPLPADWPPPAPKAPANQ